MQLHPYRALSWLSDTRLLDETYRHGLLGQGRIQAKVESALSEGRRKIEVAELHKVTLGVGHHKCFAVVVEVVHIADLE